MLRARGVQREARDAVKGHVAIGTKAAVVLLRAGLCARGRRVCVASDAAHAALPSRRAHEPRAARALFSAAACGGVAATRGPAGDALVRRRAARSEPAHHAAVPQRCGVVGSSAVAGIARCGRIGRYCAVAHAARCVAGKGAVLSIRSVSSAHRGRVAGLGVPRRGACAESTRQVSIDTAAGDRAGECHRQNEEKVAH
jgi:hypothetical protein